MLISLKGKVRKRYQTTGGRRLCFLPSFLAIFTKMIADIMYRVRKDDLVLRLFGSTAHV